MDAASWGLSGAGEPGITREGALRRGARRRSIRQRLGRLLLEASLACAATDPQVAAIINQDRLERDAGGR